eukprot:jgi/Chlat1/1237/Chrsp115S00751
MDEDTTLDAFPNEEEDDAMSDYTEDKAGDQRDLTGDGGVTKKVVKAGTGWEKPEKGDEVTVHYVGKLLDGTQFDSSRDKDVPFTFTLGQGQVIKGWDKGVASMKKDEISILTCKPDYAYGKNGAGDAIPPDSTLQFEVELLSWKSVKDITKDGGVIKKILAEGTDHEKPKHNDEVLVTYTAKLQDGTVVKQSPEGGVEFTLKEGHLCKGLVKALETMKKGEKVLLTIRSDYAFGAEGAEGVPTDATIMVEAQLQSWKKVEAITPDEKVMMKVLKEGEGYQTPNEGAKVQVKLTGRLSDGTVFEQRTEEGQELEFMTGEEQVVAGLDKAVLKMKKGQHVLLTVAPEYGYGVQETAGPLATIPANSTLQYEVEMVSFVKAKESWEMDTAEKLEQAAKKKEEGNAFYKAGKLDLAAKRYEQAIKCVEYDTSFSEEDKKQAKALKLPIYLNDAAVKLKLKQYSEAIKKCSKVLEMESTNVKALYRRAQAHIAQQDYDLAALDINKALGQDEHNRDLLLLRKQMKQLEADQRKKEAKLYGNMFDRMRKLEAKETGRKVGEEEPSSNGKHASTAEVPGPAPAGPAPMEEEV